VPAIHVFGCTCAGMKAWMAGTSPAMTAFSGESYRICP
jgi:hypothetical protein